MKNVFKQSDAVEVIDRINKLNPETKALWGKMNVSQMLAHCNVTYELIYEDKHQKPNAFMKLVLKLLVKSSVVGEKGYKKNNPTAPQFLIKEERNFEIEKKRLVDYINKTQQLGESEFDGKVSHSFGKLNKTEWNNMFYKHLNHHLAQFGV
ncbi:MAG: DUF1569 domain-containing protein [Bacteroidetes bacterium]|nr:DUF1569 domain-containing protein [Bacteroidota bacterium]MBP6402214.1 DUF1569 domain-containing protein [Bacteroidia bacterium]MBK9524009.1 DUF1569 domain-containing protein [Bacteroidota bacterium]MBK9541751.1 DUF1569 domain-containing protein [Bacteroidota bacterium]MBL0257652.1 DUF1569 domain-containing protein [Bacteroidota bacterium]